LKSYVWVVGDRWVIYVCKQMSCDEKMKKQKGIEFFTVNATVDSGTDSPERHPRGREVSVRAEDWVG
jgi:hypothetical protein